MAKWGCTHLPFRVLYTLSDGISALLYHLVRYRRRVVLANLCIAFPDWSDVQRRRTARAFYRNLLDVSLETLKGPSLSADELTTRYRFTNADLINQRLEAGESVFITLGHCGNWEWGPLAAAHFFTAPMIGIYKPIKNPYIDKYFNELRTTWGGLLTPMKKTARTIVQRRNQPSAFSFIADQTPSDVDNAHWVDFFGRETAFHHGFSKLAWQTGYWVYYCSVRRIRRGFYEIEFIDLGDRERFDDPVALTRAFAEQLTANIRQRPADWLWSHRRWKRRKGTKAVIDYTTSPR